MNTHTHTTNSNRPGLNFASKCERGLTVLFFATSFTILGIITTQHQKRENALQSVHIRVCKELTKIRHMRAHTRRTISHAMRRQNPRESGIGNCEPGYIKKASQSKARLYYCVMPICILSQYVSKREMKKQRISGHDS